MDDAKKRYQEEKKIKNDLIREKEEEAARNKSALTSKLSAIFISGLHKTMAEFSDKDLSPHPTDKTNNLGSALSRKKTMRSGLDASGTRNGVGAKKSTFFKKNPHPLLKP